MAHTFESERRVEFAETDMAGIVHFANYFRWMETAEHDFFRSLGLRLHDDEGGRPGSMRGFARVRAECEYSAPLHYQDVVQLRLVVREKGKSSLGYEITFSRGGEPCARGSMKVVCVTRDGSGRMRSVPLPPEIAAAVEVAPPELLAKRESG